MSVLSRAIKEEINIIDYAKNLGFHVKKIGREYTLEEHDSVRINPYKNVFIRNATNKGGSVIDFAMFAKNINQDDAIKELRGLLSHENLREQITLPLPDKKAKEVPLQIPKRNENYFRLYAYLCKTRKIDSSVVNHLVKRKMLFEDADHNNIVWLGYDYNGKAKFGCKRITITEPKKTANGKDPFVRGDLLGSKKHIGMFVDNKSNSLFVAEAPIDAMSIMTLFKLHNMDFTKYNYLAQAGTNGISSLIYHMEHQPGINKIYLCYDNDGAGEIARQNARKELKKLGFQGKVINKIPTLNDWNDDLKSLVEQREKLLSPVPKQKTNRQQKEKTQWEISY